MADETKTIGTVKGPDNEDINPLEKIAGKDNLEQLTQDVKDIKWGAGTIYKGAKAGMSKNKSIIGMAQDNVFEFPVFISESVPLEYATATNTLLEQVYASYLQMAISKNPVVDYRQIRSKQDGSQFSKYKTNTSKYVECVDLSYQVDACHNVINDTDNGRVFEFDILAIEDTEAAIINEYVNYQPLSEFDHYFQEAHTSERTAGDNRIRGNQGEFVNAAMGNNANRIISGNINNLTPDEYTFIRRYFETRRQHLSADQANRVDRILTRIGSHSNVSNRDHRRLVDAFAIMTAQPYIPNILSRNPNTWTHDENERIKDYFDAVRQQRENEANSSAIDDILRTIETGGHISGEQQERLQKYYDTISSQRKAESDTEHRAASQTGVADILSRPSNTWNNSEIEKLSNYFKLEDTLRGRQADREDINEIFRKLENDEPITGQEQKRLKDYYDTSISKGKSADMDESRQERDVSTRGGYISLPDGRVVAPLSVVKKLTEKGINIEKSKVELEKLSKDLQDAERAELTLNEWLKKDESDTGGYSVEEKRKRYGADIDAIRANDLLNDHMIKKSNATLLAEKVKSYQAFTNKYGITPDEFEFKSKVAKEKREERKERFETKATKAPEFIDENKIKKMNTMKPLLMSVTMSIMAQDGHVSHPMEYIVGVKTHCRIIKSSTLPEVVQYPLKEMNKATRNAKWRAGELKFFKDIIFHIKEKKQTAVDSRDPDRKWYRRLYELAHMKGDGMVSKSIAGGAYTHGLIANATIIISKSDVDHIEDVTKIDMLKPSNALKFCEELFLMSFIVVDIDNESIKILQPEESNDFSVQSLAAVNKQIAELDTAGANTREIFKMLR